MKATIVLEINVQGDHEAIDVLEKVAGSDPRITSGNAYDPGQGDILSASECNFRIGFHRHIFATS